jgi:amidase
LGRTLQPSDLDPVNAMSAEMGRAISAAQYLGAIESVQAWSRGVARWWADGHDVLVTPTIPEPPVPLGEIAPDAPDPFEVLLRLGALTTFTVPWNVTGQPAISLPLHWNDDGLPIGVQLIAAYGREDVLIRLASQLEAARPWAARRPPVSA